MTNLNSKNIILLSILSVTLACGQQNVTKGCLPSCCIKNYTNEMEEKSKGNAGDDYIVIYNKDEVLTPMEEPNELVKVKKGDIVYFTDADIKNKIRKGTVTSDGTYRYKDNLNYHFDIKVSTIIPSLLNEVVFNAAGGRYRDLIVYRPLNLEKIIRKRQN